ncbi:MAG: DNA recombination protein RmuC, partial [Pseudoalteromonas sp.]|nr:DNA recombination protein RmuC [Pseudoalteromonas sp.]
MFTQLLTHIDWLSASAGLATGLVLYGLVSLPSRNKLKQHISEQQQQLSLLQNQYDN